MYVDIVLFKKHSKVKESYRWGATFNCSGRRKFQVK